MIVSFKTGPAPPFVQSGVGVGAALAPRAPATETSANASSAEIASRFKARDVKNQKMPETRSPMCISDPFPVKRSRLL